MAHKSNSRLRTPVLQVASAFIKHNVDVFFNNYAEVQAKYKFEPSRIWNTDEIDISTVLQAPRVIAETGKRVVGQCVSAERGTTVTFCGIISAVEDSATGTPINIILVQIIKPTDVRPFPKADARKANKKSGLGKSKIYTSSPERARVEE
ncbi:hypothetical protein ILUMI_24713 [Ignelater luminosus]|uniref:Uncharacterized protein n=1 Tax=Ignelater luminosus TaxID=2038154 RepID=A0A8K0G0D5_IGNLU|nr:hypothetical protein ILUMI_24713 [Ignelater luminosus]